MAVAAAARRGVAAGGVLDMVMVRMHVAGLTVFDGHGRERREGGGGRVGGAAGAREPRGAFD